MSSTAIYSEAKKMPASNGDDGPSGAALFCKENNEIQSQEAMKSLHNESLTSFHNGEILSYTATMLKPAKSYNLLDFLAAVHHWRVDILTFGPGSDIGLGGTAKISDGGNAWTLDGRSLNFVIKRVHRETSSSDSEDKEMLALLSEVLVLGHPIVRQHPNIIGLEGISWGIVYGEPWPNLVFMRAEHGDLKEFMRTDIGRKLDFRERVRLCREIGNALFLMHSCNVVHGDLKPDNVLIFKDAEGNFSAKVADFGYSTIFAGETEGGELTLPRSWPWTAPEIELCARVSIEQAKSADIFSYGMICFWLLCHGTLKQYEDDRGPDLHVLYELKRQKILSSSACDEMRYGKVNIDVAQELSLNRFFDLSLSHDRERRRLHIDGLTVPFHCPSGTLPLIVQFGKSASLMSKPTFDLIGTFSQLRASGRPVWKKIFTCLQKRGNDDLAEVESRKTAAFQLAFCYKVGFGVAGDKEQFRYWLEKSERLVQEVEDAVAMVRGDVSGLQRDQIFTSQRGTSQSASQASLSHELVITSAVTWIASKLGLNPVKILISVRGEEHFNLKEMEEELAELGAQKGWTGMTGRLYAVLRHNFNNDDPLSNLSVEGPAEMAQSVAIPGMAEDEEKRFTQSMEKKLENLGPYHPDTLMDMEALVNFYLGQKKWEEAEKIMTQSLDARTQISGQDHPDTVTKMLELASFHMFTQHLKEAEALILQVIKIQRSVFGKKHANTLDCLGHLEYLASKFKDRGMLEKVETLIEYTVEARRQALGTEHEETLKSMVGLGTTYFKNGHKFEEGEELLTQAVMKMEKNLGIENKTTLQSMQTLVQALVLFFGQQPEKMTKAHGLHVQIQNTKSKLRELEHAKSSTSSDELESREHCFKPPNSHISAEDQVGNALSEYFEKRLDRKKIDEKLRKAKEAVDGIPEDGNPEERARTIATLASVLANRFGLTNNFDDLDAAIFWAQQAVSVLPDSHPDRALRLTEQSKYLWALYEAKGALKNLDEVIKKIEEAVEVTVDGDERQLERMQMLALRLRSRFEKINDMQDLEKAITWMKQIVDAVSKDDPRRIGWLLLLFYWLNEKSTLSENVDNLNEAIQAGEIAANVMPDDYDTKHQLLNTLSDLYDSLFFNYTKKLDDLQNCIRCAEQAVDIAATLLDRNGAPTIRGDKACGPLLSVLAKKYYYRFEFVRNEEDLVKAAACVDQAVVMLPADSENRLMVMQVHELVHARQYMLTKEQSSTKNMGTSSHSRKE